MAVRRGRSQSKQPGNTPGTEGLGPIDEVDGTHAKDSGDRRMEESQPGGRAPISNSSDNGNGQTIRTEQFAEAMKAVAESKEQVGKLLPLMNQILVRLETLEGKRNTPERIKSRRRDSVS